MMTLMPVLDALNSIRELAAAGMPSIQLSSSPSGRTRALKRSHSFRVLGLFF